jgi:hypothetical protein
LQQRRDIDLPLLSLNPLPVSSFFYSLLYFASSLHGCPGIETRR